MIIMKSPLLTWRVVGWDARFETRGSLRKRGPRGEITVTTDLDGDELGRLLAASGGFLAFAVWNLVFRLVRSGATPLSVKWPRNRQCLSMGDAFRNLGSVAGQSLLPSGQAGTESQPSLAGMGSRPVVDPVGTSPTEITFHDQTAPLQNAPAGMVFIVL